MPDEHPKSPNGSVTAGPLFQSAQQLRDDPDVIDPDPMTAHDLAAEERDRLAAARDRAADERDDAARRDREEAALDRLQAAADREQAARDRRSERSP